MIDWRMALYAAEGVKAFGSVYLRRRRPLIVNHLITVRCNLACPFCYVSGPEQIEFNRKHYPQKSEMDTGEVTGFYRQLAAAGFKLLVIVGGETLLRTDLDDVLRATQGRVYVSVFTNGFLLEERHELLRRAPSVFVSLDAPDEQHDVLRGRAGAFRRAVAGIDALRRHHPSTTVSLMTTVTDQNVDRVADMLAFAREQRLAIGFQPPSYDGQFALESRPTQVAEQRVPPVDRVADAFALIRSASRRQPVLGSRAFFDLITERRATFRCQYPWYVLGPVLPNGDVIACTSSKVKWNLRQSSVREIVESAEYRANATAGPTCERGCRDWGIFDLSAVHNTELRPGDLARLARTFARSPLRRAGADSTRTSSET